MKSKKTGYIFKYKYVIQNDIWGKKSIKKKRLKTYVLLKIIGQ